jgi:hypothetical protein
MAKTRKARPSILVPVVEEVPRISDAERDVLRASLETARADIAAGNYDVVTPEVLRGEFEGIFRHGKTNRALDATRAPDAFPPRQPASKGKRR